MSLWTRAQPRDLGPAPSPQEQELGRGARHGTLLILRVSFLRKRSPFPNPELSEPLLPLPHS